MEAVAIERKPEAMRRALLLFAETMLRPLIRILLRYGLSYPEFNQMARKLYVDIAMHEAEFRIPQRRRQYKARVACLTGLSRKEVLRLLYSKRAVEDPNFSSYNRASRVLEGWWSDERYRNAAGQPVSLPFRAAHGRRSFTGLVMEYSGDIPPRAILDELRRAGACTSGSDDDIRPISAQYVAREFDIEMMTTTAMRAAASLARIDAALVPMDTANAVRALPLRQR